MNCLLWKILSILSVCKMAARRKHHKERCPLCRGKRRIILGAFSEIIRIIHWASINGNSMRCPLCYGAGLVTVDLSAAFTLMFGDLRIAEYKAVTELRLSYNTALHE